MKTYKKNRDQILQHQEERYDRIARKKVEKNDRQRGRERAIRESIKEYHN
jgi:hypothetical protein